MENTEEWRYFISCGGVEGILICRGHTYISSKYTYDLVVQIQQLKTTRDSSYCNKKRKACKAYFPSEYIKYIGSGIL